MLVVGLGLIGLLVQKKTEREANASEESSGKPHAVTSPAPTGTSSTVAPMHDRLADRAKREELRKKILEAWAKGEQGPEAAEEAKQGRFEEHLGGTPTTPNDTAIDPKYVQLEMREQMFPMARACYEDYLSRQPDAGGKLDLWFKIVADDKLGGIVEEDEEHDAGVASGMGDEKMTTCIRESMMTVTFPPPAKGGVVTIGYPIVFSAGDDD
jgi:hypothetical protein